MEYSYEKAKTLCRKYDPAMLVNISDKDIEYIEEG
jgi:hypothetical protein